MATIIAWSCGVCQNAMRTFLPAMEFDPSPDTKSFTVTCAACGAARFLVVAANQPLVDVKTVAAKG